MVRYNVGIIGIGADPDNPTKDSYAMAYRHADAYQQLDECRLASCVDHTREHAEAFAQQFGIDDAHVYEDHTEMLASENLDIISVCTQPANHVTPVIDATNVDSVKAIHCEKPMALTWRESRRMAQACERKNIQLTFNHHRRLADLFRTPKALLDEGRIGELQRITYTWGDFFELGTHAIDICNYFNDQHHTEWVLACLDYREENVWFGTHNENQMLALWKYENDVFGMASTGDGAETFDGDWNIQGTTGSIAVYLDELEILVTSDGNQPEHVDCDRTENWYLRTIRDVVYALRDGRESELCAKNALSATEIMFAGYESVRRRGRIDLPLRIDDNPLESMVQDGTLAPSPATESEDA